jgi:hypothetical protein
MVSRHSLVLGIGIVLLGSVAVYAQDLADYVFGLEEIKAGGQSPELGVRHCYTRKASS